MHTDRISRLEFIIAHHSKSYVCNTLRDEIKRAEEAAERTVAFWGAHEKLIDDLADRIIEMRNDLADVQMIKIGDEDPIDVRDAMQVPALKKALLRAVDAGKLVYCRNRWVQTGTEI